MTASPQLQSLLAAVVVGVVLLSEALLVHCSDGGGSNVVGFKRKESIVSIESSRPIDGPFKRPKVDLFKRPAITSTPAALSRPIQSYRFVHFNREQVEKLAEIAETLAFDYSSDASDLTMSIFMRNWQENGGASNLIGTLLAEAMFCRVEPRVPRVGEDAEDDTPYRELYSLAVPLAVGRSESPENVRRNFYCLARLPFYHLTLRVLEVVIDQNEDADGEGLKSEAQDNSINLDRMKILKALLEQRIRVSEYVINEADYKDITERIDLSHEKSMEIADPQVKKWWKRLVETTIHRLRLLAQNARKKAVQLWEQLGIKATPKEVSGQLVLMAKAKARELSGRLVLMGKETAEQLFDQLLTKVSAQPREMLKGSLESRAKTLLDQMVGAAEKKANDFLDKLVEKADRKAKELVTAIGGEPKGVKRYGSVEATLIGEGEEAKKKRRRMGDAGGDQEAATPIVEVGGEGKVSDPISTGGGDKEAVGPISAGVGLAGGPLGSGGVVGGKAANANHSGGKATLKSFGAGYALEGAVRSSGGVGDEVGGDKATRAIDGGVNAKGENTQVSALSAVKEGSAPENPAMVAKKQLDQWIEEAKMNAKKLLDQLVSGGQVKEFLDQLVTDTNVNVKDKWDDLVKKATKKVQEVPRKVMESEVKKHLDKVVKAAKSHVKTMADKSVQEATDYGEKLLNRWAVDAKKHLKKLSDRWATEAENYAKTLFKTFVEMAEAAAKKQLDHMVGAAEAKMKEHLDLIMADVVGPIGGGAGGISEPAFKHSYY